MSKVSIFFVTWCIVSFSLCLSSSKILLKTDDFSKIFTKEDQLFLENKIESLNQLKLPFASDAKNLVIALRRINKEYSGICFVRDLDRKFILSDQVFAQDSQALDIYTAIHEYCLNRHVYHRMLNLFKKEEFLYCNQSYIKKKYNNTRTVFRQGEDLYGVISYHKEERKRGFLLYPIIAYKNIE